VKSFCGWEIHTSKYTHTHVHTRTHTSSTLKSQIEVGEFTDSEIIVRLGETHKQIHTQAHTRTHASYP